jgi:ligand-binding sensor domain-containing protein
MTVRHDHLFLKIGEHQPARRRPIALLCLLVFVTSPLAGNSAYPPTGASERSEYVVTSWHIQDGLPSDRVQAVLQTRDGYIWVATFNGLARFDGVQFQRFNDANTPELHNSLANCLFDDSSGRLWVGSDTGEISWRDANGFHSLAVPTNWPSAPVDRFAQAGDGDMYVVGRGGIILRFRDCKFEDIIGQPAGQQYADLTVDNQGNVWAVRFGGALIQLRNGAEVGEGPRSVRDSYRDVTTARRGGVWVRDGSRLRRWENNQWIEDRGAHSTAPTVLATTSFPALRATMNKISGLARTEED